MQVNTVILGAGLSGLSCAQKIRDDCVVFEKKPYVGGLSATLEYKGHLFDIGGHRFFTYDTAIRDYFIKMLSDCVLEVNRVSHIFWRGRFITYPIKPTVLLKMSPVDSMLSFATYVWRHLKPLSGSDFESISRNRFGDRIFELFFEHYTEKVWGMSCSMISSELAESRLQNVSLSNAIKHSLFLSEKSKSFADRFHYPEKGIGMLVERMAEGLDVRLGSEVTGVNASEDRIESVVVGGSQEIECKNLVSTIPITDLLEMLDVPDDVSCEANELSYRGVVCVFILLNKKSYSSSHWLYFPGPQVFGRIHESKNWSPKMSDEDTTGLCLEVFCSKGDDIWNLKDGQLFESVIGDIPGVSRDDVSGYTVHREEHAYPVYVNGFEKHLSNILKHLSRYKNLHVLGRTGSYSYDNMDVCMEKGFALGNLVAQGD